MRQVTGSIATGGDEGYFVRRMQASVAAAEAAADSLARLIHFDLAGRYSVAALAARRLMTAVPAK